ncbi:histidinol dehydrogenase [Miniphocaeibacter halophilus]|uniref:Histidinol dehydrogenase n=1 Tax=Miniphocaeibacter halophilus TaxID=2931922 RepID=A0AC61MQ72_9FIRM|nr:histidinol dehydrogenase [Miniphocaeibacter halophilus]QQK07827.1 histidinol dehydrogenase [Miniphocaeibacter halophilus]
MRIIEIKDGMNKRKTLNELLKREDEDNLEIENTVRDIINNIKRNGDVALKEYTYKFDRVELENIKVSKEEVEEAIDIVGEEFLNILKEASENIRIYHEEEVETTWFKDFGPGIKLGQKITPIKRVGLYVPGGTAGYPSTVLMTAIPAKVAGVKSLAMVTPPDSSGKVDPYILAAAYVANIDEIYKVGGAQAIAALAYGTETIEPVYKIVGPGNIFVATAKKQVFGKVDIDMIAGPSEIGILADEKSNPRIIAADLLSQAEHDEMAAPIFITTSKEQAEKVEEEVYKQIEKLPRKDINLKSIENYALGIIARNKDEAIEWMNEFAPEHLEILYDNPETYLDKITNAGAIFLGEYSPEPVGDYFAGPNHTLPTSGTAKFSSPLGVYDYFKRSSIIQYNKDALEKVGDKVQKFAKKEGLFAHANAIDIRFQED